MADEEENDEDSFREKTRQLVTHYLAKAVKEGVDRKHLAEIIRSPELSAAAKLERLRGMCSNTYMEKLEALQKEVDNDESGEESRSDSTSTSGIEVVNGSMLVGGKNIATLRRLREQEDNDKSDDQGQQQQLMAKGTRKRKKKDDEDDAQVKKRKICREEDCTRFAQKGGKCHKCAGVQPKQCSEEDCTKVAQKGGKCHKCAGIQPKQCSEEDCTRVAQKGGKCRKCAGVQQSSS